MISAALLLVAALVIVGLCKELRAAELARDSYRLELMRAWADVDRYRAQLGLSPTVRKTTTDLRLNREQPEAP